MCIAIHHRKGSFSEKWIAYCDENNIGYKIVDCYQNDIIQQISDCSSLMWHFHHTNPLDFIFAKQLLKAVEFSGRNVFPNSQTSWHFDDKIGQKYLLESTEISIPQTYVFYKKQDAIDWITSADFPKVFKLRGGAGSAHVRLIKSKEQALELANRAFGKGFSRYNGPANFFERLRKYRNQKTSLFDVLKGVIRLFYKTNFSKAAGREKGYIYFQDFVPGNSYDIRVIVVANKAFAIKRLVRENDFRASGSGEVLYGIENFNKETLQKAFEISEKLKTQCIAFDFVYKDNKPILVEMSYAFTMKVYEPCSGYWDKDMNWHAGDFNPYGWMVDLMRKEEA